MVQLVEMAAKSALLRTESRGVHYREDYPNTDNDRWLKESVVKRTAGRLRGDPGSRDRHDHDASHRGHALPRLRQEDDGIPLGYRGQTLKEEAR